MKCSRCGQQHDCQAFGPIALCRPCLLLIVREWAIKQNEFRQLSKS